MLTAEEPYEEDASEVGLEIGELRLCDLPPFPRPDYASRNGQAASGIFVVVTIVGLLVALPHGVGATAPRAVPIFAAMDGPTIGFICLYVEAFLAIVCLLGILFGDPGNLKRTHASCFPLPPTIADKLRAKQPLDYVENIHVNGQVFCVRWRVPRGIATRLQPVCLLPSHHRSAAC